MKSIFKIADELGQKGITCALCTVVATSGSTPLKSGAKMLVTEDGTIYGTIGGGHLEKKVIVNAHDLIAKKESGLFHHNLLQQHGMCCGGTVSVFIEFLLKPARLYIFGSGHVGRALARMASALPFDVYLIDGRKQELDLIAGENISKIPLSYTEILPSLPFNENTFIAVMTHDHAMDREIVAACMRKPFAYLGMIGSRRKAEITRKMFLSSGLFTPEEFAKLDCPMGMDIHAKNPEEIAVSILARLIEVKNKTVPGEINHHLLSGITEHENT